MRSVFVRLGTGVICCAIVAALCTGCGAPKRQPVPAEEEVKDATAPTAESAEPPQNAEPQEEEAADTPEPVPEPSAAPDYAGLIQDALNAGQGRCFFGIHVYPGDYRYQQDSGPVKSASVIKVFVMEYAFRELDRGALTMDSRIDGQPLSALLEAMITRSDNDAANSLISYFTMDALNAFFTEQGYTETSLQRKMLDTQAQAEGRDNYTSIADVMRFLDKLYQGQGRYGEMLALMKRQQVKTKIQKNLPPGVSAANKTGELSDVENDIGIVFTPSGDFAVAFLTSDVRDTAGMRNAISSAVGEVCQALCP